MKYSNEITKFQILIIKNLDKQIEFLELFLKENPNLNENQKNGLIKLKKGINTVISGNFITLENDYKSYEISDICLLGDVFFEFYNRHRIAIDENSRNEFDKTMKKINLESKLDCLKNFPNK